MSFQLQHQAQESVGLSECIGTLFLNNFGPVILNYPSSLIVALTVDSGNNNPSPNGDMIFVHIAGYR